MMQIASSLLAATDIATNASNAALEGHVMAKWKLLEQRLTSLVILAYLL